VFVAYFLLRSFGAEYVPRERTLLLEFIYGDGAWIDDDIFERRNFGFSKRFGVFFDYYRRDRHWFLLLEMLISSVMAVVDAVHADPGECYKGSVGLTFILAFYLLVYVALRPFASKLNLVFFLGLGFAQFLSAALITSYHDGGDRWTEGMASGILTIAMFAVPLKVVFDITMLVIEWRFATDRPGTPITHGADTESTVYDKAVPLLAYPTSADPGPQGSPSQGPYNSNLHASTPPLTSAQFLPQHFSQPNQSEGVLRSQAIDAGALAAPPISRSQSPPVSPSRNVSPSPPYKLSVVVMEGEGGSPSRQLPYRHVPTPIRPESPIHYLDATLDTSQSPDFARLAQLYQ
jgi:hypothetical protein